MKTKLQLTAALLLLSTLILHPCAAFAQGTAFTYQGRLNDGAGVANGIYDLRFAVYDASSGGTQPGGALTNSPVNVSNGLFTVALDFGAGVFTGPARWLDIGVRTNGGTTFTALTPRQQLTPTPYAIFAGGANAAGLSGTIPAAAIGGTYSNSVNFNNGTNSFDGNFIGSGAGLGDVWHTTGNLGTTPGVNFLGTTDNQPLDLRVNNSRAFHLEPTANDGAHASIVNVIGGSPANMVSNGVYGATIAGGGAAYYFGFPATNAVTKDFGTVSGGFGNTSSGNNATVGGGYGNTSSALEATIGGGHVNISSGGAATVGGGFLNISSNNSTTVAGGAYNVAGGQEAAVGGGQYNVASGAWSVISGGNANMVSGTSSVIGGGQGNVATNGWSVIGGGYYNTNSGLEGFIGTGFFNSISPAGNDSFIGSGANNINNGYDSFVGTGYGNSVNSDYSFIGGGANSLIQSNSIYSFIGGGQNNLIQPNADHSVIGGGGFNTIGTNANGAAIDSGFVNTIGNFADRATIAGGNGNAIQNNSTGSTISGGVVNIIGTNTGTATIAGGNYNSIANNSGQATIGGGLANSNAGFAATIPGGYYNVAAGIYSFAAGQRAKATNDGAFVWADSQNLDFGSTTTNQFNVRANGGVRFVTGGAGITLDGQPVLGSGAFAPASGSASYIQNQTAASQNASFNINGSMTAASFAVGNGSAVGTVAANALIVTNNLRVPGAGIGASTPVFVHRATGANIETGSTHRTTITHPLCDGDPNAILIITHNYNPGNTGNILDVNPTSVYYNASLSKWQIYHDNFVAMTTNSAYNVLIVKP